MTTVVVIVVVEFEILACEVNEPPEATLALRLLILI